MKLIGVPGSHPSLAAELMLRRKGIAYRRIDLPNMSQRLLLPLLRFPAKTVPALLDGRRRVQTTPRIARFLDEVRPEPRLVPDDPRVLALEAWADDTLQDNARRIGQWGAKHDLAAARAIARGSRLVLKPLMLVAFPLVGRILISRFPANDEGVRRRLSELPAHLDRVDAAIAEGVIGGDEPNVADYQVATSVRLLLLFEQLRPLIEQRPAGAHALRVVPDYPGGYAAVLPDAWLEPLRRAH